MQFSSSHEIHAYNQAVENLKNTLSCPVELEPLFASVNLVPCSHKVNKATAEQLFGQMPCSKPYKNCPVCASPVQAYHEDHAMQSLANLIFKSPISNFLVNETQIMSTHGIVQETEKKNKIIEINPDEMEDIIEEEIIDQNHPRENQEFEYQIDSEAAMEDEKEEGI